MGFNTFVHINPSAISRSVLEDRRMLRTSKKARLAVAAVLAVTASPESSPQKAKKRKQRSASTPVEVDDSRDDSPAKPSLYLLRCTNHNTDICRSRFQCQNICAAIE